MCHLLLLLNSLPQGLLTFYTDISVYLLLQVHDNINDFFFLSSSVSRIFGHVLDDSHSKSGLVSSLSVCISLLDPKRSVPSPPFYSFRGQHMYETPVQVNQETVGAMLPKLGEFCTYDVCTLALIFSMLNCNGILISNPTFI